jgi:uncharacterized membrane protein (UPF0182 family)
VLRGNLLVIPLGRGLLYVEPIFLQANQSPMPELRLVVLGTQERHRLRHRFREARLEVLSKVTTHTPRLSRPGRHPKWLDANARIHTAGGQCRNRVQGTHAGARRRQVLRNRQQALPVRHRQATAHSDRRQMI